MNKPLTSTEEPAGETQALVVLNKLERTKFKDLEKTISEGMTTFVDVGSALLEIRNSRLYREDFDSFEDYCRSRWDMSKQHAIRLIQSSQVMENIGKAGYVPRAESVVRPLVNLEPEKQKKVWDEIKKRVGTSKEVTARLVIDTARSFGFTPLQNPGRPPGSKSAPNGAKAKKNGTVTVEDAPEEAGGLTNGQRRRLISSIDAWFRAWEPKNDKATPQQVVKSLKQIILNA